MKKYVVAAIAVVGLLACGAEEVDLSADFGEDKRSSKPQLSFQIDKNDGCPITGFGGDAYKNLNKKRLAEAVAIKASYDANFMAYHYQLQGSALDARIADARAKASRNQLECEELKTLYEASWCKSSNGSTTPQSLAECATRKPVCINGSASCSAAAEVDRSKKKPPTPIFEFVQVIKDGSVYRIKARLKSHVLDADAYTFHVGRVRSNANLLCDRSDPSKLIRDLEFNYAFSDNVTEAQKRLELDIKVCAYKGAARSDGYYSYSKPAVIVDTKSNLVAVDTRLRAYSKLFVSSAADCSKPVTRQEKLGTIYTCGTVAVGTTVINNVREITKHVLARPSISRERTGLQESQLTNGQGYWIHDEACSAGLVYRAIEIENVSATAVVERNVCAEKDGNFYDFVVEYPPQDETADWRICAGGAFTLGDLTWIGSHPYLRVGTQNSASLFVLRNGDYSDGVWSYDLLVDTGRSLIETPWRVFAYNQRVSNGSPNYYNFRIDGSNKCLSETDNTFAARDCGAFTALYVVCE